jgi:hypothetical protein
MLDLVLWDSHPLSLGATPKQVFIDGIAQIRRPHTNAKPIASQRVPNTPDFGNEAKETLKHDGLPPLETKTSNSDIVIFSNVHSVFLRRGKEIEEILPAADAAGAFAAVVVQGGNITCIGTLLRCSSFQHSRRVERIDLEGGSISSVAISFPNVCLFIYRLFLDPPLLAMVAVSVSTILMVNPQLTTARLMTR